MAAKDFIVAIELGSSKVTGIAGKKNLDGSISVLAVVKEDSSSFIRKGVVYNINQTVQCVSNIVKKLSAALKSEIAQVYVGVGGQSIRSEKNVIGKDLLGDTIVTQEMVNELMDTNRNMSYPEQEILDAATQEYKVDNQLQLDPVGIQCSRLEATSSTYYGARPSTATSTSVSTLPALPLPRCIWRRWRWPTACCPTLRSVQDACSLTLVPIPPLFLFTIRIFFAILLSYLSAATTSPRISLRCRWTMRMREDEAEIRKCLY